MEEIIAKYRNNELSYFQCFDMLVECIMAFKGIKNREEVKLSVMHFINAYSE